DVLVRVERGEVVEEDPLAGLLRVLEVDRLHLDQREVLFVLLRMPHLARDRVSGQQAEAVDLGGGDVDVVRPGKVVVVRRAQEAVPVGKNLQDPLGEDVAPLLRLDRKSTRLNSSHVSISYAVFRLKK